MISDQKMDIKSENIISSYNNLPEASQNVNIRFQQVEEESKYFCYVCKKAFYNIKALQNHKNMQHDADESGSDVDAIDYKKNGTLDSSFVYVPHKGAGADPQTTINGFTTRVFSEDTTFLIVRVEVNETDGEDKTRNFDIGHKNQPKLTKLKETVDLRGPFTCNFYSSSQPEIQCQQIFFNCCEYSLHYREEHTKRRKAALRCQICEKRLDRDFLRITNVNEEYPAVSPNRCTFSCRRCGQIFLDSTGYDEHNRLVHAKMKPHECSICTKRFTQQAGLQQHMRMHTGIRPFACLFCPKAFTQKAGLDQHLRIHTKVKPFKCVICNKGFSQSVHLRQHMRTHTNIQPFQCSVCSRRFKQSSHLNFHMRSHVGYPESLVVERYAHAVQEQDQIKFLNFANLQPVQDGETLYYAAEIANELPSSSFNQISYFYQDQTKNMPII